MKIGLPKALLHYYYYPFWRTMFEELGCEVVLSDDTNSAIIEEGSRVTVSELCVPIKIFNGHIENLIKKKPDFIFIARFISRGREWYCPKFIGLGEIVDYSVDFGSCIPIYTDITSKNDIPDRLSDYEPVMKALGITKKRMKQALAAAKAAFVKCRRLSEQGHTIDEVFTIYDGGEAPLCTRSENVTIALMGYVNNIYDNFVSMNAIKKLRGMGVNVVTFDMLCDDVIRGKGSKVRQPFWVFARKIYNASVYFEEHGMIDGMIHLTAFGCGPDSIIGKMMETDCEEKNIPFMTLRVDEHTGESHVQTRLEAFIDMLKLRHKKRAEAAKTGGAAL